MMARESDPDDPAARPRRPGVFLAFAPQDASPASSLDTLLRAGGARTAFDESRELHDGLPSEPVLQDLGACDALLLVWSRHTADDAGVSAQRRLAASFDKPRLVRSLDAAQVPEDAGRQFPPEDDDDDVVAAIYRILGVQPQERAPRPQFAVEPGRWRITGDARHGETLELELMAARDAGSTPATSAGYLTGVHWRAGIEGKVTGRWWSNAAEGQLDLQLETSFGLRPYQALRRLQLLGGTGRQITAEDLHGIATVLHYRLVRE
jgi:hypothetical protein